MKTVAAILVAPNTKLEVDEIDVPDLDVGQVLVKVGHSGICGKQVDEIIGKRPDPYLPHLLGHEAAGMVEGVGPGVRKVKPGDAVCLHWVKGTGIDSATPRFLRNGRPINAGQVTTFSRHTVVSENRVTPIGAGIATDVAALLGCALTTGMGIVTNNARLKPGQSIAVFGVGGVGINVVQGARLVNAHPIIAVDVDDRKLRRAEQFGATSAVNLLNEDPVSRLRELTQNKGVDVAVDTVGASSVRTSAYDVTADGGITVFAGVPRADERITIDSFPLHFGRTIVGSHGGDTKPDIDIPRYVALYRLGKLKLEEQITHTFPLLKINEAFAAMLDGSAGRIVLDMG